MPPTRATLMACGCPGGYINMGDALRRLPRTRGREV
jgi:hypothetical protein